MHGTAARAGLAPRQKGVKCGAWRQDCNARRPRALMLLRAAQTPCPTCPPNKAWLVWSAPFREAVPAAHAHAAHECRRRSRCFVWIGGRSICCAHCARRPTLTPVAPPTPGVRVLASAGSFPLPSGAVERLRALQLPQAEAVQTLPPQGGTPTQRSVRCQARTYNSRLSSCCGERWKCVICSSLTPVPCCVALLDLSTALAHM